MEELEPAREQVNFVWLAVIGVVLAAAMGAGAVWIKRFVGRRVAPLPVAAVDDVDPEAAAAAVEVAARVANSASRLPANVRRMIREGTHADLEELCRHGGTALLQGAEDAQEGSEEDTEDIETLELRANIQMLDDRRLEGAERGNGHSHRRFGDPLVRAKLATSYLLTPTEAAEATSKVDPRSVVELHLGCLQTITLQTLQKSTRGVGAGMDVLIEGPLLKLATVANIRCWVATYARVWADGRWAEMDGFVQTDGQEAPELDVVPTDVATVFEVVLGADPGKLPADTKTEPHDATLTVRTGKRGTITQFYCAADAAHADKWVSRCKALAKTSVLPQPALIQFLEDRSLGNFATKLAELTKIRTVDQLAITPVSDTTLLLVGMNRFKQRLYRRAVSEAYRQQSAAAAKAAEAGDVPTVFELAEGEKRRHEDQKKKIKVTEKSRAKKRKEDVEAPGAHSLDAIGARLMFDVQPMDVIELRKLMGESDAQIHADYEARARDSQRAAEKAEQQAKVAVNGGSLLEGWACESCMHFNQDPNVKVCAGCSAPAHLVGGPNITSKKDARGEDRPTTPGGTIITKAQGSVLQTVKQTDEEIAAAKKAHEEREQAEAEQKELGGGRGATPKKLTRNLNLDTATMITDLEARQGRVDKEKIQKRQRALEQAAAARAERFVAPEVETLPRLPIRREPSRRFSARFVRWAKSLWKTAPWVLRLRRGVPLTVPQLPGTAAFGSVRRGKYLEQKTKKSRRPPTKDSNAAFGVAGPGTAHQAWDSDSEDENEGGQLSSDGRANVHGVDYDSDENGRDPDDWWYHYMLKHGTDKIMRRK